MNWYQIRISILICTAPGILFGIMSLLNEDDMLLADPLEQWIIKGMMVLWVVTFAIHVTNWGAA